MSRRGAIFHWIIFGIVAAIGLFFLLTGSFKPSTEVRGEWHLGFVHDAVYAAEVDLLALDQDARDFGQKLALQLAENGGFREDSTCGKYNEKQLWNDKENWCLVNVKNSISNLYQQHFLPRKFEITFIDAVVIGKSGRKTIDLSQKYIQNYTYDYDFTVDLSYNFEEYLLLEQDARALVTLCKNSDNLMKCLEKKPLYWDFCDADITSTTVAFCFPSLVDAVVNGKSLRYQFALDFS